MSQSTDAILAFGFNLTDEDESLAELFSIEDDDGEFEFDEWIAQRAGVSYRSGMSPEEYGAYSAAKDRALAECPVEVVTHCSDEYRMHFLALRGTVTTANRGYPKAVTTWTPEQARIDAMKAFCEEHGLDWQAPGWHLFSYWG